MTSFISKNKGGKMPKIKFNEKFFYCPIFKSKNDYEKRMRTDLAADIFNDMYLTVASYAEYDRSTCLFAIFGMILADKIIKIDNKAYKRLINNTVIEAKNNLSDFLRECRKK